jgi:hypothetical protein
VFLEIWLNQLDGTRNLLSKSLKKKENQEDKLGIKEILNLKIQDELL